MSAPIAHRRFASRVALGACLAWVSLGCEGSITGGGGGTGSNAGLPGSGGPQAVEPGGPSAMLPAAPCSDGSTRGAARESVRRLSRDELRATLTDLLPGALGAVEQDIADFSNDGDYLDAFQPFYSSAQASKWMSIADVAAEHIAGDPSARGALGSDACLNNASPDEACYKSMLSSFLPRAFRRPVNSDEVGKLAQYAASKGAGGLSALVSRILMAPDFLFRLESGVSSETLRVRLTEHEVASRISYAVLGSMPDAELRAAADAGKLHTLADVEAQVRRLSQGPAAKQKIQTFFGQWTQLDRIAAPDSELLADWAKLPGTPGEAKAALQQDVTDFVQAILWTEQGSFKDLFSKRTSYTQSSFLQSVYGASGAASVAGAGYSTPNHAGLPLRAGLLVGAGLNTNPIHRGATFLKRFLCQVLPSPDPAAVAKAQQQLTTLDPHTTPSFERVKTVTSAAACQGCHAGINAAGFLFESYDPIGRFRTEETYIQSNDGQLETVTHPLPGTVSGLQLGEGLPTSFNSALELADAVAGSELARGCMSAFMLRNLEQRREAPTDQCALADVSAVLAEGRPVLDAFVASVVNEDIFWRKL